MDVLGRIKKVPTLLFVGLLTVVGTIINYTVENSEPPKWVSKLLGLSGAALDDFVAQKVPFWSVLMWGVFFTLVAGTSIALLAVKYEQAKKRVRELSQGNGELQQSIDALRDVNKEIAAKRAELSKGLSCAQSTLADLKVERDAAKAELSRLKSTAKKVPFTVERLMSAGAFIHPVNSSLSPKAARMYSRTEVSVDYKNKILKAVMLCTKKKWGASTKDIKDLVDIGQDQLDVYLGSLISDGYLKVNQQGFYPFYHLTPEANMHFVSLENGVASELKFS